MKYLTLILLALFVSSCVSKKKHISMLANQEVKLETLRRGELAKMNRQIKKLQDSLRVYEIRSASQSGSIGTLESLRKEIEEKNQQLKEQIEALSAKSSSSEKTLRDELKNKSNEIDALNGKLDQIRQTLQKEEIDLGTLVGDLRPALGQADPNKYSITSSREAVVLQMNEELLFARGSVSKLSSSGRNLLASMAQVLQRFPALEIEIRGHTDNNRPKTGYSDNWTISVIRAVSVTKELVNENGVSATQITASGRGEYSPIASNDDKPGQSTNRRVELHFKLAAENLVQKIKRITG